MERRNFPVSRVVGFGEVMMRLTPPGFLRFDQAHSFDVNFTGAEANVLASLARFGHAVEIVTRLPDNDLGDAGIAFLRSLGIGTRHILRGGDRLGLFFVEMGAMQRPSKVIYDRAGSAIAAASPGLFDWPAILSDADWLHWTGITPAVSKGLAAACLEAVQIARARGLTISCDLNYRKKLWQWGKRASEVMPQLVSLCDIAIGNEEDAEAVFGLQAPGAQVEAGRVSAEAYRPVCEQLHARFPNLKLVAITLRGSISASHNTWTAVAFDGKTLFAAPIYDLTHIVDRVGGGDAFAGGLIHGLLANWDLEQALRFAVAASCLKHSIYGDSNRASLAEVEALMRGSGSGRVQR